MRGMLWTLTSAAVAVVLGMGVAQGGASPASTLTPQEREGLLWMREEEKLARDVYLTLGKLYPIPAFQNIARSEEQHMAAVARLLAAYGLPDPAQGKGVGEFSNPELARLYQELVAKGQASLQAALAVGAYIEELDIQDLRVRLAQPQRPDIVAVYQNLMQGSWNHLRAFAGNLSAVTKEPYRAQLLSQAEVDAALRRFPGRP
ncbi:DUF2202 domain-containing protein [Thermus caliditerrae]|uniref:DUF2202 domain-containing protein n=1 Tax=Thermus caliditerrae TaxID=1330700 RepID=UPI0009DCA749|nr:DUF2202 domain-containing protein [Thermus caliditerrae]